MSSLLFEMRPTDPVTLVLGHGGRLRHRASSQLRAGPQGKQTRPGRGVEQRLRSRSTGRPWRYSGRIHILPTPFP